MIYYAYIGGMPFGKETVKPTTHYLLYHSDVEWELVLLTVLSSTTDHPNKRLGKDRHTYIKWFDHFIIEVHTKNDDVEGIIWVINAFRTER